MIIPYSYMMAHSWSKMVINFDHATRFKRFPPIYTDLRDKFEPIKIEKR